MSVRFAILNLITLAAMLGCSPKLEQKTATPTSNGLFVSAEAISRLEAADKADGVTDHLIGKCYVCGLGMDGSKKFAVKVQDYTAHLCSKACQHKFEESADQIVLSTEIPVENKQE
jgi:hypothetical protein